MPLIDVKIVRDALDNGKAQRFKDGLDYIRFRSSFRGIERGTIIVGKKIIWGFPHIKRIFTLQNGLKRNIPSPYVYVEEKIDGFNVRVASIAGQIYAFSRGGFLDLFATEKVREMHLEKFFKLYSNYILCGEMIGNTPHTSPTKDFDVKFLVFDIDQGDGNYLPCEEKYSILKKCDVESVPALGKFKSDDYVGLGKTALSLNKSRKEGMVIKSSDRNMVIKYVTPTAGIDDISKTASMFFDMPIGFYYQRVLRSSFFIDDFGLDKQKYSEMLGKAFYLGLTSSIEKAKKGIELDEEFEILIRDPDIWTDVKKHMGKDVDLEILWKRQEKGRTRIHFRKLYKKTKKLLSSFASGNGVTD